MKKDFDDFIFDACYKLVLGMGITFVTIIAGGFILLIIKLIKEAIM